MGLEVVVTERGSGVYVIEPRGEINTQTYAILEDKVKCALDKAKAMLLDMGQVDYISSMGLSAVFRIKLALEKRGGALAFANMRPQIDKVFKTMKIVSEQMFASLEEADEYLDRFLDGIQKGSIKSR